MTVKATLRPWGVTPPIAESYHPDFDAAMRWVEASLPKGTHDYVYSIEEVNLDSVDQRDEEAWHLVDGHGVEPADIEDATLVEIRDLHDENHDSENFGHEIAREVEAEER